MFTIKASEYVENGYARRSDIEVYVGNLRVHYDRAGVGGDGRYNFAVGSAEYPERYHYRPSTIFTVKPLTDEAAREFALTATQRKWLSELRQPDTWIEPSAEHVGFEILRLRKLRAITTKSIGRIRQETLKALLPFLKSETANMWQYQPITR